MVGTFVNFDFKVFKESVLNGNTTLFVENALFTLESLRKLLQNIKTHESTVASTPIESQLTK